MWYLSSLIALLLWNSLPVDVVDFVSLSRFRSSLRLIDFSSYLVVDCLITYVKYCTTVQGKKYLGCFAVAGCEGLKLPSISSIHFS